MIDKSNIRPIQRPGSLLRVALLLLAPLTLACAGISAVSRTPATATITPTLPPSPPVSRPRSGAISAPTPAPTAQPTPVPTPSPLPAPAAGATTLTLCTGGPSPYVSALVRAATHDGPFDIVNYDIRAVLLEEVPSLADGDAVITAVPVHAGDLVIDAAGRRVPLVPGLKVHPAGCRASGCAVTVPAAGSTPLLMDQLSVRFRLCQKGWQWSDGTPLTAHDSVRAFETGAEPSAIPRQATASYTAQNDSQILWIGLPGYLPTSYALAFWTPIPPVAAPCEPHETGPGAHGTGSNAPASPCPPPSPVYGPYAIVAQDPDRYIRLLRNPHYLRRDGTAPAFDEVWFRFWPDPAPGSSGDTAGKDVVDALETGVCDILTPDLGLAHTLPRLEALQEAGSARLVAVPAPTWEHLTFNLKASPPIFADVRTRQAVAFCLDREALMTTATHGHGGLLDTYLPPEHPLAIPVESYAYIPDRGVTLLRQVGWNDDDGDGIREASGIPGIPDGTPLHLRYLTTAHAPTGVPSPDREAVARQVTRYLNACGFAVEVVALPYWEFHARHGSSPLISGQFDLAQFGWASTLAPSCDLYVTGAIPVPPPNRTLRGRPPLEDTPGDFPGLFVPVIRYGWTGTNLGGFSEVAYDRACALAAWSLPGEPEYTRAHQQAQHIFSELLPALPLYRPASFLALRPNLEGVLPDPVAAETWHIEGFR
jgi:peptide/nickel transport system substrate-binding protein